MGQQSPTIDDGHYYSMYGKKQPRSNSWGLYICTWNVQTTTTRDHTSTYKFLLFPFDIGFYYKVKNPSYIQWSRKQNKTNCVSIYKATSCKLFHWSTKTFLLLSMECCLVIVLSVLRKEGASRMKNRKFQALVWYCTSKATVDLLFSVKYRLLILTLTLSFTPTSCTVLYTVYACTPTYML